MFGSPIAEHGVSHVWSYFCTSITIVILARAFKASVLRTGPPTY